MESMHVFILCVASALFISWVMKLKKEIILLLDEANRLRSVVGSAASDRTRP